MAKTMGFRNSGKVNVGGKNMQYVLAGAFIIIVTGVMIMIFWPGQCGGNARSSNQVKCTECGEEWSVSGEELKIFRKEILMGRPRAAQDCPKCGKKQCVFLMNRCPECKKYYLPQSITDRSAYEEGGSQDICPHCGTNVSKWVKEHRQ